MWKFAKSHSQDVFSRGCVLAVQGAEPAQVIIEVVGGDAVKAMDPLFEASMVGVDVLNGVEGDVTVLGKVAVGRIAIAGQQNICRKNRLQYTTQLRFGDLSTPRDPFQCLSGTVSGKKNAHLIIGQPRFAGFAATPAR